jgi:hypothetical protein
MPISWTLNFSLQLKEGVEIGYFHLDRLVHSEALSTRWMRFSASHTNTNCGSWSYWCPRGRSNWLSDSRILKDQHRWYQTSDLGTNLSQFNSVPVFTARLHRIYVILEVGSNGEAPHLYVRSDRLVCRLVQRLSSLRVSVPFLSPFREIPGQYLTIGRDQLLLYSLQFILIIILSFDTVCCTSEGNIKETRNETRT